MGGSACFLCKAELWVEAALSQLLMVSGGGVTALEHAGNVELTLALHS